MSDVTAPRRMPPQPGLDTEEPEERQEDDIPSDDHNPDGTQPQSHDGDEVERHAD